MSLRHFCLILRTLGLFLRVRTWDKIKVEEMRHNQKRKKKQLSWPPICSWFQEHWDLSSRVEDMRQNQSQGNETELEEEEEEKKLYWPPVWAAEKTKVSKGNCTGENWEQLRKTIGRKCGREHASREILCTVWGAKNIFLFFHKGWILPWSGGKHVLQFCCNRCCNAHVFQCLLLVSFQKTVQKVQRLTKTHFSHKNYITWSLYNFNFKL